MTSSRAGVDARGRCGAQPGVRVGKEASRVNEAGEQARRAQPDASNHQTTFARHRTSPRREMIRTEQLPVDRTDQRLL